MHRRRAPVKRFSTEKIKKTPSIITKKLLANLCNTEKLKIRIDKHNKNVVQCKCG